MKKLTVQEDLLTYQNSFPPAASHIITEHDDSLLPGESNSLAMLEKKAEEVLSSASQGILSNNLMDELAYANDNANSLARNDPALFKHRCRYCGKIFGSDSSLQIHVRSHTGERPYKCNICGSRFTTRGNLKVHFQRHSDKYPHIPMNPNPVPEHLDKYFPPLMPHEALKEGPSSPEHMPVHMQNPFPCLEPRQLIQREMIPEFFLPRPPIDYMMNNVKDILPVDPVDLSHIPQKIPVKLVSTPQLSPDVAPNENSEIKLEPMEEEVVETDEEDEPKSPPSLEPQTILTEEHGEYDEEERENSRKITRASNCEKTKIASVSPASNSSSNSGSLYQDTVLDPTYFPSHHMPRPDSTDSSWENFIEITSDASKLQDLVDSSDNKNIEPNQCLVCKKTLSCRSALQMHYRVHTGDRPFRCKICGRSFTTKGNLKTHMSVHRIKPPMRTLHQCPVCHQKFSNIFVLQQHIRLHTGEQTDLTPDQIRAAEIREFDSPFGVRGIPADLLGQKRKIDVSDDESELNRLEKSPKVQESVSKHIERPRYNPVEQHAEDLRSLHLQKLSVRSSSRDNFSRGSSPISQTSIETKRMRSSSPPIIPKTPPVLRNQSPISTSPSAEHFPPSRPHLPYGNPFLGMPQFPPFMNQPAFMRNMPMLPHGSNMPQFGLFGEYSESSK
jgi:sal-like protein